MRSFSLCEKQSWYVAGYLNHTKGKAGNGILSSADNTNSVSPSPMPSWSTGGYRLMVDSSATSVCPDWHNRSTWSSYSARERKRELLEAEYLAAASCSPTDQHSASTDIARMHLRCTGECKCDCAPSYARGQGRQRWMGYSGYQINVFPYEHLIPVLSLVYMYMHKQKVWTFYR